MWKALFYCMWMADKPMPQVNFSVIINIQKLSKPSRVLCCNVVVMVLQEQLADQISSLVEVFESKPNVMNLFVEWFFRTMAREWPYIDRFRMDKFCMV